MATKSTPEKTPEATGNTAVPGHGDHDRVTMLSLNADGTPDQNAPELIGDKETALAATKEQFAQQAVSAVDAEKRAEVGFASPDEVDTSDVAIDKLRVEHEKVATAAEKAAEATVNSLHQG